MADRLVALPGCLVGSWRGISFHVPDISTPAGRRIVSIDLPGTEVTLHEDLGLYTGPIKVTGLIAGDDVAARAAALQTACETTGPGTLVHPWLGAMTVVLVQPADIRFEAGKLRTVAVQMTFERWSAPAEVTGGLATLADIADAAMAIGGIVSDLADLAFDLVDVVDCLGTIAEIVDEAVTTTLAGSLLSELIGAAGLDAVIAVIDDAAGIATWISDCMSVIARAGVPPSSPAIGVGPLGRASEAAVDPWATVTALLSVATALAGASSAADDDGTSLVRIGAAIAAVRAATDPLAAVGWESRQQAMAARARISSAIAIVASAVIGAAAVTEASASTRREAWRGLAALRRTIHQDLDDRIGRLPSVMRVSPPTRVSAWIVAQHLFGDDPTAVLSGFEDIVTRNNLAHPSICDVDPIEVLPQ